MFKFKKTVSPAVGYAVLAAAVFLSFSAIFMSNKFLASLSGSISDPNNLADGVHVLFVDQNNPSCSNSNTRSQALNPSTPWCDAGFEKSGILQPGDNVYFKSGTYGYLFVADSGTQGNVITYQPYPGDTVTISDGVTLPLSGGSSAVSGSWSLIDSVNNIYATIWTLRSNLPPYLIKRGDFGIAKVNNQSNLTDGSKSYSDMFYYNPSNNEIFFKKSNSTNLSDVFISDRYAINGGSNAYYIQIKGFNINYSVDGIWNIPNLHAVGNTVSNISSQGIGGGDGSIIEGNNITYVGSHSDAGLDHAIYDDGENIIIRNNYIRYTSGQGIQSYSSDVNANIYSNNINSAVISGDNINFYNNIISGGASQGYSDSGLQVFPSTNMNIYNNLILNSYFTPWWSSSEEFVFKNNIIYSQNDPHCIVFYGDPGQNPKFSDLGNIILDNNIYYNCGDFMISGEVANSYYETFSNYKYSSGQEQHSVWLDPLVKNDNSGLLAGSPAIGNGTCIASADYYGNNRPSSNCDIGPFQTQPTSASAQIQNNISTYVDGACGTANKIYPAGSTSFGSDTFCLFGRVQNAPSFPLAGGSVSWTCLGLGGGKNFYCQASLPGQSNPIDGACGSANKIYPAGSTSFGSDAFCTVGVLNSNPSFPFPGNPISWTCNGINGGKPANCGASISIQSQLNNGLLTAHLFYRQTQTMEKYYQIKILQQMLARDDTVYPLGKVTGYFGLWTLRAVQAFQVKYGILKWGDPGYGVVGPKTRAKLNSLYSNL